MATVLETDQECLVLCQKHSPLSLICSITVDGFRTFKWIDCIDDLCLIAPTLLQLLSTIVSHRDHHNEKTVTGHYPGISMTTEVSFKVHNKEMCGVRSHNLPLLYSSHAEVNAQNFLHIGHENKY